MSDRTLDWTPGDWKRVGERLLDLTGQLTSDWDRRRPAPEAGALTAALSGLQGPLPEQGEPAEATLAEVARCLVPASAFNGHPRWLAYITGAPAPAAVLGEWLAATLNQNVGLWRLAPGATTLELQTIDWIKQLLDYPSEAQGIFVSGGQMANTVALAVARQTGAPWDVRAHGVQGPDGAAPRLRLYASQEAHYCHQQAAELLGLGREAVRPVPVDAAYRMQVEALGRMIAEDRARGHRPLAVVGTAGTVGTGAVDPLPELRRVADAEGLWLHVDGAYGAFARLVPGTPPALRALSDADSVACDPHKWLFAPVGAGVVLVRRPGLLDQTFAFHPPYLEDPGGGRPTDLLERSPENSRPFRALSVWLALRALGRTGYAEAIGRTLELAGRLEARVRATPGLRLATPRELSIVCWRAEPAGLADPRALDRLQSRIIAEMERRGLAILSGARLAGGGTALRACLVNFRTGPADVDAVVEASAALGRELAPTVG